MPEISRFLGISIYMYFNEHNPPHFHVKYNEYRGMMSIQELELLEGKLPRRIKLLVMEWASDHREELMRNWESIRASGHYQKIEPLV